MSRSGSEPLLTDLSFDDHSTTALETNLYNFGLTEVGQSPALLRNWQSGSAVLVSNRDCLPGSDVFVGRRVSFDFCDAGSQRTNSAAFEEYVELLSTNSSAACTEDGQRRRLLALTSNTEGTWAISSKGTETFQPLSHWILGLEKGDEGVDKLVNTLLSVIDCIELAEANGTTVVSCNPARFRISQAGRVELADLSGTTHPATASSMWTSLKSGDQTINQTLRLETSSMKTEAFLKHNLRYLAPETAASGTLTAQTNVYGLGAMLYEMIAGGRVDNLGDTEQVVDILEGVHRHVTYVPTDPMAISTSSTPPPQQLVDITMKCLAKDAQKRYSSIASLGDDLRRFGKVRRGSQAMLSVGHADRIGRFAPPKSPLHRQTALTELDGSATTSDSFNVWGLSGAGKSHLVEHWANKPANQSKFGFVGRAKLDQQAQRTLASFSQIFESLIAQMISDPRLQPAIWVDKWKQALETQFPLFLATLSQEHRRVLNLELRDDLSKFNLELLPTASVSWSSRVLQTFAEPDKPLLLLIDDIQWMPPEEIKIWRTLMDGPDALRHVHVISTYRVESLSNTPKPEDLLSASTVQIYLPLFSLAATKEYISACCHHALRDSDRLAETLFKQSSGNPLFLKTLVAEMVSSRQLRFDVKAVEWRCDQTFTTQEVTQMDTYIDGLFVGLPDASQELLVYLSCLPSRGCHADVLALLLDKTTDQLSNNVDTLVASGILQRSDNGTVHFSHDRQQSAAARLIDRFRAIDVHRQIASILTAGDLRNNFFFEGVDSAIIAVSKSEVAPDVDTIVLVLEATKRAALSASFSLAYRYSQVSDEYFLTFKEFRITHHDLYFRHLRLAVDICGVMALRKEQEQGLDELQSICSSVDEELVWAISAIRISAGNMDHRRAANIALLMIIKCGYDVDNLDTTDLDLDLDDTELLWGRWQSHAPNPDDRSSLLLSLLAFVGPSFYIARSDLVRPVMAFAFRLLMSHDALHDGAGYLLGIYCMTNPADIDMHQSLHRLAVRAVQASPVTSHSDAGLAGCAAIVHGWIPLADVHEHFRAAYTRAKAYGNWAMHIYVMMMDLGARTFASVALDQKAVLERYRDYPLHVPFAARSLVHLCLQYNESATIKPDSDKLWSMSGRLFNAKSIEDYAGSGLHQALFHGYRLRLAIFYGAPIDTLRSIMLAVEPHEANILGMSFGNEWVFLQSIVEILGGTGTKPDLAILKGCASSPDYAARLDLLTALEALHNRGYNKEIDDCLKRLDLNNQHELSGLLGSYTGTTILKNTGNLRQAAGYLNIACQSFVKSGSTGFARHLVSRFPDICHIQEEVVSVPIDIGPPRASPPSASTSSAVRSQPTVLSDTTSGASSGLDAITLVRSSLLLMEEKEPTTILYRLLQLMCQNTRADYAAIAMCDEQNMSSLKLAAAGTFDSITLHNMPLENPACQNLCPVSYLTQVFRTGRAMIVGSTSMQVKRDDFYAEDPKSLICLPILHQGLKAGVILLSSSVVTNSDMALTQEVISCLATYGVIVTRLHTYIDRLDARTSELRTALEAKTSFLSHCSHELRTPLSAILGMTSVLAANPDLSGIQREHLSIIQDSGADLLTLISDILDQTRLDSKQVVLDPAPFVLRDVVDGVLRSMASVAQNKGLEICLLNSFDDDPPILFADGFRVKQVLLNFMSNGIKFTSVGKVTVEWKWQARGDVIDVCIDVVDTGIGISESKMPRLFQTFSQVDSSIRRAFGGSGLGLSIARELAKLLGGDCTASSTPGAGSTFTFKFKAGKMGPSGLAPIDHPPSCLVFDEDPGHPHLNSLMANLRFLGSRVSLQQSLGDDNEASPGDKAPCDILLIDEDIAPGCLDQLKRQHQNAQLFVLARSVRLTEVMTKFSLRRNEILSLPIEGKLLRQALVQCTVGHTTRPPGPGAPRIVTSRKYDLGLTCPLQILLVDDNHVNIKVGRKILSMLRYGKTEAVFDGQQALNAMERREYDLVLLDLQMPVLDGYSAHQKIVELYGRPTVGGPCVVALSANADQETQRICLEQGFFSYLSKPIDVSRLESVLRRVYEIRQNHSPRDTLRPGHS